MEKATLAQGIRKVHNWESTPMSALVGGVVYRVPEVLRKHVSEQAPSAMGE